MSTTETPNDLKEPGEPEAVSGQPETAQADGSGRVPSGRSRWLDYDSHELLEMISDLEDERREVLLREAFCGRSSMILLFRPDPDSGGLRGSAGD